MATTGSEALAAAVQLRMLLIVIAVTYAALGAMLVLLDAGSALSVGGRVLIVGLLCLQVMRGHNWARLLLGAFTALVTVVMLLSSGLSFLNSLTGIVLAGLVIALGGAYVALFVHPAARAQFDTARARRTSSVAAL